MKCAVKEILPLVTYDYLALQIQTSFLTPQYVIHHRYFLFLSTDTVVVSQITASPEKQQC